MRPALWARFRGHLGICARHRTADQIPGIGWHFPALGNEQDLPETCLIPWVSSKGMAIIVKWFLQLQGNMNDFRSHQESACHGIQGVSPLLLSGSASSDLASFCLPAFSLQWGINNHFSAQLSEAGIIH